MFERLEQIEERYEELAQLMADPEVAQDYQRIAEYAKERSDLEEIVTVYRGIQSDR